MSRTDKLGRTDRQTDRQTDAQWAGSREKTGKQNREKTGTTQSMSTNDRVDGKDMFDQ